MYIGRDFKRDIELDNLNEYTSNLRPTRSWLDLFTLSLSNCFCYNKFDFTILTNNLSEDEVIIIDSHDDILKEYQIYFWSKDRISDILPATMCPSFISETNFFKTSEKRKIREFIDDQIHAKSLVIENIGDKLSINLVYGDTIKITPDTLDDDQDTIFYNKLQERYKLWLINNCACKPKKIRVQADDFDTFQEAIDMLKWNSNINDAKLGMYIVSEDNDLSFSKYDKMFFNHSTRWLSDKETNFIFTGDKLAVVVDGNYYNFRLDQRTKESEYSCIEGQI